MMMSMMMALLSMICHGYDDEDDNDDNDVDGDDDDDDVDDDDDGTCWAGDFMMGIGCAASCFRPGSKCHWKGRHQRRARG